MRLPLAIAVPLVLVASACSEAGPAASPGAAPASSVGSSGPASTATSAPTPTPGPTPTSEPVPRASPQPRLGPSDVDLDTALDAVGVLAGEIGPRPGHTRAYFRAADYVQGRLTDFGWTVERQRFPTPAGRFDGQPVAAGPSVNLIATRGDVTTGEPYLVVGAHLDTVPGAPGAEDNASGVATMLAIAEAASERRTRLPVVLVAFGSEEPRGPGDDDHHYGSRPYVASLSRAQRRSLEAMVSLDRVGVGSVVPVGTPAEPNELTDELQAVAQGVGVPTQVDPFQRSSDHWSLVRDGLPGARLGSTPYAGYHSAGDTPSVIDPSQLERTARLVAGWLR